MITNEIMTYLHPKLGKILFSKDEKEHAIFDENKIREIMVKSFLYLHDKDLIPSEKFKDLLTAVAEVPIIIIDGLESEGYSIKYNVTDLTIVSQSFSFASEWFALGIEKTMDSILHLFCAMITDYLNLDEKIKDKENNGDGHGEYWRKYARILISIKEAKHYEDVYTAMDYLKNELNKDEIAKFESSFGEDWVSEIAYNYVNQIEEEYDDDEECIYSISDFVEDQMYEIEKDNNNN
jgi:hypothetical protein